jgi:hypothetical protein
LEAEEFPIVRTVDSASWLVESVRGRVVGVAMRLAVLGLAFVHRFAQAAVTSARTDNGASLGVSRRIGYTDNGISLTNSGHGPVELRHMRITAGEWRSSGQGGQVEVEGCEPCLPWFAPGARGPGASSAEPPVEGFAPDLP